jgi:putative flippase GtrA
MKIIGIITTVLITLILSPIWRGYALSKLWLWFIVSTFGAAPLGIAQSIGLALVVSFLTHQYDSYEDKEKSATERMVTGVVIAFLSPAMALLIGWIVKGFLG